jgi:hypothetical protein
LTVLPIQRLNVQLHPGSRGGVDQDLRGFIPKVYEEPKRITALKRSGRTPCTHVIDLVHLKLENIERALADPAEVRGQMPGPLRSWRSRRDRPAAVCPCIEHLKVVKGGR